MKRSELKSNAFDRTVSSLCWEIDDLKEQVNYWKSKFEEEVKLNNEISAERLSDAKKGVGQALMFALSIKDDVEGNLIIPAENRQTLAEQFK